MKTKHPYFDPCKDVWMAYYSTKKPTPYYWSAKDATHLHQLMKKIESEIVRLSMEVNTENMVNSFRSFLESITDKWVLNESLEVATVNSKWNSLYAKAVSQSPLGRAESVRDSVEEYLRRKNSQGTGR